MRNSPSDVDGVQEVMHGQRLGRWAKSRRERLGMQQDDVAATMSAELGADIDPNWVTQLETGRKKRAIQQPYFGALVRALRSTEVEALKASGLLIDAPDQHLDGPVFEANDPASLAVDVLRGLNEADRWLALRMLQAIEAGGVPPPRVLPGHGG